jgi:hypothetical protein
MKVQRLRAWFLGGFIVLTIFHPRHGLAEPLEHWHLKPSLSQGHSLRICYGNGTFVAVGEPGSLYTSSDGETWTWRNSGENQSLGDVAFGGGAFVAVGGGGTILSSPDGVTWTWRNSGINQDLYGVVYGSNTFVAVGDQGSILTSPDGATWALWNSSTHQSLKKVTYGNGIFVAVGGNGIILTSPDGAAWTVQNSGTRAHLEGVAYGKKTFVAVGETILTSSEGAAWTGRAGKTNHHLFGVAYGSGFFAAVAENGAILTSSDGCQWTLRDSGTHLTLYGIVHGKEKFLAAGEKGVLLLSEPLPSPQISVSSSFLDFGEVPVGGSSFANLTISNAGSANLIIRQITLSGPDTLDFNTRDDNCTGATLSSSQDCSVQIAFSPRSAGSKSATLSISSNDPDTLTQTVSLSGSGTDGGAVVSSGSTGFSCFFSTSVRKTGLEDYLQVLRKFRDTVLSRSHPGKRLVDFYYQHSPALARMIAQDDFLRKAVAFGLVPPLAAIAYVTLHASLAEKAFLFILMAGAMTGGWRLVRRSGINRIKSTLAARTPAF